MIYGDNREEYRSYFYQAWDKYKHKQMLDPLETQIINLLLEHSEYQEIFDHPEKYLKKNYAEGEVNPFLHLSLHLTVRDQINLDQPHGIAQLYQQLLFKLESHQAEHKIMEALANELWFMQKQQQSFNIESYLQRLNHYLNSFQK